MSDLIKSESGNKMTPSGRGTRGKKAADRQKVALNATETTVDVVAGSTMVDAAIDLADAELGAATGAYLQRTSDNMGRFGDFTRMVQAQAAQAIKKQAYEQFEVSEEMLYGSTDA